MDRCVPIVLDDGTAETPEQAVAICHSLWEQRTGGATLKKSVFAKLVSHALRQLRGPNDPQLRVAVWSNASSGFPSVADYCDACLINVNRQGVPSAALAFLPIRAADGGYNRDGLIAAAGGAGLVSLERPDGVSRDRWSAAIRNGARTLIDQYTRRGWQAPEHLYELGEVSPPDGLKRRAISATSIMEQVWAYVWELAEAGGAMMWPIDLYWDRGFMFMILSMDGRLYRVDVTVEDGTVVLGQMVQVIENFLPVETRMLRTIRQPDGRYRWVQVSCSAVMNRVGEIDSRDLFDSFVERAAATGVYPILNFSHLGGIRLGEADYVARDGYLYITSGLYDDTPIGEAAALGVMREPDYWGHSIEYVSDGESQIVTIHTDAGVDVDLPVFRTGVNTGIALCAEHKAAALYTGTKITRGTDNMNQATYDDLVRLVGADLAAQFQAATDETNRQIETGVAAGEVIARSTAVEETGVDAHDESAVEDVEEAAGGEDAEAVELGAETSFELDDGAVAAIAQAVTQTDAFEGLFARFEEAVNTLAGMGEAVQGLQAASAAGARTLAELTERVGYLEQDDQERQEAWVQDAPRVSPRRAVRVTHRPRQQQQTPAGRGGDMDYAAIAEATLASLP